MDLMPRIPRRFAFVLLAAFILGGSLFAYLNSSESTKQSFIPDLISGYSISKEEDLATSSPSASVAPLLSPSPKSPKHY
jgi:hypothetical protein